MTKQLIHQHIMLALEQLLHTAEQAAIQAYDTATNSETVAENKYDTFSLEASYLAAGQSKRVLECRQHIQTFAELSVQQYHHDMAIGLGALVTLENLSGESSHYFMSDVAGGLSVKLDDFDFTLITPQAPLGKALLGLYCGDEVSLNLAESASQLTIVALQ